MKVFVLLLVFSLCVGQFTLASAKDDATTIDEEVQEDAAVEDESDEDISLLDILAHSLLGEEDDDDEIDEDEAEHDVGKREIDASTDTADVKTEEDSDEDKSLNDPFLLGWKLAPVRRRQSFRRRGVPLYGLKSALLERLLYVPPRRQLSRPRRPIIIRVTPVVTRRRRPSSIFGLFKKKFLFDEEEDENVDEEISSDQIESDASLARYNRRRNPIRTRITVRKTTNPRRQQYLGLQRRQPLRVRVRLNDEPTTKDEF